MYPVMVASSEKMLDYITRTIATRPANGIFTAEMTAKYTTQVVSACVFAIDAKSFESENPLVRRFSSDMVDNSMKFVALVFLTELIPILHNFVKFSFVPPHIVDFFVGVMKQSKSARLASSSSSSSSATVPPADYLTYLLELQKKRNMSDLELGAPGHHVPVRGLRVVAYNAGKHAASNRHPHRRAGSSARGD